MSELKPPTVLILTRHPKLAERLSSVLAGATDRVWHPADTLPEGEIIDVMVTDLATADDARRLTARFRGADAAARLFSYAAILGFGTIDWADVTLDASAPDESIRLACTLLGEIGRLRAEHEVVTRLGRRHRELAYTDPLTGLANRRAWDEAILAMHTAPVAGPYGWCLAIVDLDHFKGVNEAHGLAVGDRVLQQVATRLSAALRERDLVARLGGDEFGVLLECVTPDEAAAILGRLRQAVAARAALPVTTDVTASIGYIVVTDSAAGSDKLFTAAERALRAAKCAGGNRIELGAP
jgi:diguanylate cyclase (GGDEF)-like protein